MNSQLIPTTRLTTHNSPPQQLYDFELINRLPPYTLGVVTQLMLDARRRGEDIINMGMGNPDGATPHHIVDKLCEAVLKPKNHRYSVSRGIPKLREAICEWYKKRYDVVLNPESEAIVTIGAKEGLSHLILAMIQPGEKIFVQDPSYPIHSYAVIIARGEVIGVEAGTGIDFLSNLKHALEVVKPRPKLLIISYPSNPTGETIDLDFFERLVAVARENNLRIIHDLAYADLTFDGYKAPSILQIKGARDVAVEFYSLSKGYNMPGWRVGFCVGNPEMIYALARIKSYLDYGMFTPIQVAATVALKGPQECVHKIVKTYEERRNVLCDGLINAGWPVDKPKATMFVWGRIPEKFQKMGSLEFSKLLLKKGKVAVSPGIGFGRFGEGYVRFALVENKNRIKQAVRGIKDVLKVTL